MIAFGGDMDVCQPAILNDAGNACWQQGCFESSACSFYGVQLSGYWSSSSYVAAATNAWLGDLDYGGINMADKGDEFYAWPVRGGQ